MTLKEFISQNNVTSYEGINNTLIINAVVDDSPYGLDVDTSMIESGTPIIRSYDFTLNGDLLTVLGITININDTNML